ncbi:MAG: ADP-ribosylglycohydrolase family protein [Candidatus Absconditicoccaceae bacterium]
MKNNTELSNLQKQQLQNKIQSGLLGGSIGDALGAPVEMRTGGNIKKNFGKIVEYISILNNGGFKEKGFPTDLGGFVTDDTLLTFAIVKSYNELGKLDLNDIFKKHQEAYDSFPYGFGGATKYGMKNIQEGIPLEQSGLKDSAGNGVVMKQFPFAAVAATQDIPEEEMIDMIVTHARATHDSDIAVVSSITHHKFLKTLLETQPGKLNKKELLNNLITFIKPYEEKFPKDENKMTNILSGLRDAIDEETNKLNLSDEEILDKFGRGNIETDDPRDVFKSAYVIFTLGIVYAIFLRDENFDVILNSINIGGDTDSYAAIAGNMVGAYNGIEYEDKYINGLQKKDEILSDTQAFIAKLFSE